MIEAVCATICRLAFLNVDAVKALQWIQESYPGDVRLVHIGFPTPFTTRSSDETSKSYTPRTVHDKPDFMVQARSPNRTTQFSYFCAVDCGSYEFACSIMKSLMLVAR